MRHETLSAALNRLNRALSKRSVLSLVALLGTLFSANCSDVPTSPELSGPGSDLQSLAAKPSLTGPSWTVEQTMTNQGGLMPLDGLQVVSSFPAGALPVESTTIIARMKLNAPKGRANRIEFDFQPSMTFQSPVELRLVNTYLAGTSPKYILWYYNPATSSWEKQDEQSVSEGYPIVFKLSHYSGYSVSR
jgi:hypothetical protein